MPRGKPGAGRQDVPRPFAAVYDDGEGQWMVKQGDRFRAARTLCIQVTVTDNGPMLTGVGVVRCVKRGELVVTA